MAAMWLERWRDVLDAEVETVLDVLTARTPDAVEFAQNSPFAGVLPDTDRQAVLAAFTRRWRREHAA